MEQQVRWLWLGLLISTGGWLVINYFDYNDKVANGQITVESTRQIDNQQQSTNQSTDIPLPQNNQVNSNTSVASDITQQTQSDTSGYTPTLGSENQISNLSEIPLTEVIEIETDSYLATISLNGGNLIKLSLKKYPVSVHQKDVPTQLLQYRNPSYSIQSGILSKQISADHYTTYKADKKNYVLDFNQKELSVPLYFEKDGIRMTKTFIFKRNSHEIKLFQKVMNNTEKPWSGASYTQLSRAQPLEDGDAFIYTYTGSAWWSEESGYKKIDFEKMDTESPTLNAKDGWVSMIQHYFVSAIIPSAEQDNRFYTNRSKDQYIIGSISPQYLVQSGQEQLFNDTIFIGPKNQEELVKTHPTLDYSVDYGIFHFFSAPLFWILKQLYNIFGNWAVAIILITMLIKLAFLKLSEKSYRSMARMKLLTPRIKQLRERYGDDKQTLNQKMMKIYKDEKVNPLGGCLPVIVQIPVFISLYWVLIESVELRQAPFMLWIEDLTISDPYFVLPVLMGITMFLQQKLNPAMGDPMQQKVMQFLPVIFTVFFLFFPAGLVLYWVVNNVLSIAQQWYITKKISSEQKNK